jgi:hypothetical protein
MSITVKASSTKETPPYIQSEEERVAKLWRGTTDHTRWRLKDDDSRHTWHYLPDEEACKDWPQSYAEKSYLDLPLVSNSFFPQIYYIN